jgi:Fe-S-cluster containining protein
MSAQNTIERLSNEITEVGNLTHTLALRYEGIFTLIRYGLSEALSDATCLAQAARDATAIADAAASALLYSFPNQAKLDCKSGCNACCHLYVKVPPGVATVMARHIQLTFSLSERDWLHDRLIEAVEAIDTTEHPERLRHPCPLLAEDGQCSVYEVRPLVCRAFTSASAYRCQQMVFGTGTGAIDQNLGYYRVYAEATRALEQAAIRLGQPSRQKALAHALLEELTGD